MHVLMGANTPDDRLGGVSRNLYSLGDELQQRGHRVTYALANVMGVLPRALAARLPARLTYPLALLLWLRREMKSGARFDVVQVKGYDGYLYGLARSLNRQLPPYLLSSYQLEDKVWEEEKEEVRLGRHRITLWGRLNYFWTALLPLRIAVRTADGYVVNPYDADWLETKYRMPRDRFVVWLNGVSRAYFQPRNGRGGLRVLFNGTWMWRKGIADLAVIVPDVLRRVPGSSFTLLTTPNCDLRRGLPEDLRSRVAVVHRLSEAELLSLYRDHDVFVHPTVNDPPLPLVVLEAMAAGLAVVTSRLPHFDRMIRSGENGILVTPRRSQEFADAVVTLLHDLALRERLGAEAQRTALQYTWDRVVEDLLAAYDKVAPAGTPGGRPIEAGAGQTGAGP